MKHLFPIVLGFFFSISTAMAQECVIVVPVAPVTPNPVAGQCEVSAPTLAASRLEYASTCTSPRVDCDKIGGEWVCASFRIDSSYTPVGNPTVPSVPVSTITPRINWADSYSANGKCYIDSTFDHNIGNVVVSTPAGNQTVRQVAAKLGAGPGIAGNPLYNDVQCGNGPANDAGDEDICPGRVDQGRAGCSVIGPLWDLAGAYDVTPVTPVTPVTGIVTATGRTVTEARDKFASQYPGVRRADCDPVGGNWVCSSGVIGSNAPGAVVGTPSTPSTPGTPVTGSTVRIQVETGSANGWANRGTSLEWTGANFYPESQAGQGTITYPVTVTGDGIYELRLRARAAKQTAGRGDVHNDVWIRMNGSPAPGEIDVRDFHKVFSSGNGSWTVAGTVEAGSRKDKFRQKLTAGTYDLQISGRSNGYEIDYIELFPVGSVSVPSTPVNTARYKDGDLLALNYDSSMDPDDLQAMIAAREILDDMPGVNFLATNGTKTNRNSTIVRGSTEHMRTMFPNGLDAFADPVNTRNSTAASWQEVLDRGNTVWVAEGGPSDFTADVIRILERRGVSRAALKRIIVVQHSHGSGGFNEQKTSRANMDYVKNRAVYRTVGNGNSGATHQGIKSPKYLDRNAQLRRFDSIAYNSKYGSQWRFARPQTPSKVDFSDTVEVTYILGITGVDTVAAFTDRYIK